MTNLIDMIEVNNLTCEYAPGTPALSVHELNIRSGELTFVVGASGSGKSTLLEALGLMTETARSTPDYSFKLKPTEDNSTVELCDYWQWDATKRSAMRSQFFSFIFQQENMFKSVSAMENMLLTTLQSSEREEQEANERIAEMAQTLLPGVVLTKPIMAYSGGQRQRFAFIRALAKPHRMLLADEPTGNLDPLKAQEAMGMTKAVVKEKNTAAVIVSHDIQLALKNADCIILIEKPLDAGGEPAAGQIEPSTVFRKKQDKWKSSNSELTEKQLRAVIEQSLQSLNTQ